MKLITTIIVGMLSMVFLNAQVGIDTDTPNGASILDVVSSEKGIMIPRLTSAERDSNLADNDLLTVPPAGVVNMEIEPSLLIFNTTENAFQFWDGELWRQLFTNTSTNAGNDGAVKIDGQNDDPQDKPNFVFTNQGSGFRPLQEVIYAHPLAFAPSPTTSWPENELSPGTDAIYPDVATNDFRWRENNVKGQVHVWRLIVNVLAGASSTASAMAILRNLDSNFEVNSISQLPHGSQAGNTLTFYFYTIADDASLGSERGYKIYLTADVACTMEVESLTRISLFKD